MIKLRRGEPKQEVSIISYRKRYAEPGTSPGTLRAHEVRRVEKVTISVIDYNEDTYEERVVSSVEECFVYRDTPTVTWINVTGLHDIEVIQKLGEKFGLHPLALEDVLNTGQRPKLDEYDEHYFIVVRELQWQDGLQADQISLFLGPKYVITFQELEGDVFDPVRERLRKGKGRIRRMAADYLAYALIDKVVDELFPILEVYGERLEELEDELIERPGRQTLQEIHRIKRDLLALRRTIWPEREVINSLQREESHLIRAETKIYLRDVYDHTVQIVEIIETYRDLAAGMLDVYLSSISNRMNDIMKVLTIIATIFIPLTFIVGVYGMNFNPTSSPWNMPELNWYWGYPAVLAAMAALALFMLLYFRRRGWL
ncbi:MAG: magnesium/cobalt transporter CorA [Acidobacteria bacterium]|nr:magnesium/cobalt transporter CorA [Acidobacteriota bacterium]